MYFPALHIFTKSKNFSNLVHRTAETYQKKLSNSKIGQMETGSFCLGRQYNTCEFIFCTSTLLVDPHCCYLTLSPHLKFAWHIRKSGSLENAPSFCKLPTTSVTHVISFSAQSHCVCTLIFSFS